MLSIKKKSKTIFDFYAFRGLLMAFLRVDISHLFVNLIRRKIDYETLRELTKLEKLKANLNSIEFEKIRN